MNSVVLRGKARRFYSCPIGLAVQDTGFSAREVIGSNPIWGTGHTLIWRSGLAAVEPQDKSGGVAEKGRTAPRTFLS